MLYQKFKKDFNEAALLVMDNSHKNSDLNVDTKIEDSNPFEVVEQKRSDISAMAATDDDTATRSISIDINIAEETGQGQEKARSRSRSNAVALDPV